MEDILKDLNLNQINKQDGIYILTNDPGLNINENNEYNYVGYDHIGELYSGIDNWYNISDEYLLLANKMKDLYGSEKLLLDIGCGDGLVTVPFAKVGFSVIAGDISIRMLSLLQKKAILNHVSLDKTYICKLNAYNLPFKDNSMDIVVAREMLHLVSEPYKVMDEINRVLKKGGMYLLLTNSPNCKSNSIHLDNQLVNEVISYFQKQYWEEIDEKYLTNQIKYSWKFNQEAAADQYFSHKEKILIKEGGEVKEEGLNYFFDRYEGKAFSNLTNIDSSIHQSAYQKALSKCINKYGDNFINHVSTKYISDDFNVIIYAK